MLQRIQSVWLLLAAAFDATTFRFPFYRGDWKKDAVATDIDLNAQTEPWLAVLSVGVGLLALITIFLYGNRKRQAKLCYLGIFLTAALLALYFFEMTAFFNGTIALWCIFYIGMLLCYIFAAKGIQRDEKLIRSMDRLR